MLTKSTNIVKVWVISVDNFSTETLYCSYLRQWCNCWCFTTSLQKNHCCCFTSEPLSSNCVTQPRTLTTGNLRIVQPVWMLCLLGMQLRAIVPLVAGQRPVGRRQAADEKAHSMGASMACACMKRSFTGCVWSCGSKRRVSPAHRLLEFHDASRDCCAHGTRRRGALSTNGLHINSSEIPSGNKSRARTEEALLMWRNPVKNCRSVLHTTGLHKIMW